MSQTNLPTCYFPDRSIDTLSVPCNNTAQELGGASSCCRPNDACYDSGACFQDWSGVMYRQSCTDPTFRDPACPKMCLGDGMLKDGVWILTCDMAAGKACCLTNDTSCCGSESSWFDFKPGYIKAVLNGDGSNRLGPYISAGESHSLTSVTTSTSQTSAISTEKTNSVISPSIAANQSSDPSPSPSFSTAAIGATASLGALLVISITALIFIYLRRSKRDKQGFAESPQMQSTFVASSTTQGQPQVPFNGQSGISSMNNTSIERAWPIAGELPGDINHYELESSNEPRVGYKI
ncbi:uncharacterized protein F4812DRAFT_237870 [Daldinia caldariorum]|uniref:uncharacterized protein n=1 Tax=Daldinia caldariorum TaxID=326644 RepID=UPI0020088B28|nr:uncharacterized protein F4812DRAFT_237870 [Daldinia caldariorum]KAI1463687.1 hypothetical protein F4812DRAFT_237870 [Daldinia caldariorum]